MPPAGLAVDLEDLAVTARPQLDAADIAHARDLAACSAVGLQNDLLELRRIGERGRDVRGELEVLARWRRRHAELAGGDIGVLLSEWR